jgi:hypothetical protein
MTTWIRNPHQNSVGIWFGSFSSPKAFEEYAKSQFLVELGLTDRKLFPIWQLEHEYSASGDFQETVGKLVCSASFAPAVKKAIAKRRMASFNSVAAIKCYFPDSAEVPATKHIEFLGYFPFDPESDMLADDTPPYFDRKKVSVWCGTFPTLDAFNAYFSLPDHIPRSRRILLTYLAHHFKIPHYEREFVAYLTSRAMRPVDVADLVSKLPISKKEQKAVCKSAESRGIATINFVYAAFELDYDQIGEQERGEKLSKRSVHYLGSFTAPRR